MEKSQVIGGIICLVLAAFLTVVYIQLPPEKLMFMVGDNNVPLPPIILAVTGLLLLITARRKKQREG